MDANKKQNLLNTRVEKYKAMDADQKQQLLGKTRLAYQNMERKEKEEVLVRKRKVASNARLGKATGHNNLDSCLTCFQIKIREGPYYICSVCNRILYRKTVTE